MSRLTRRLQVLIDEARWERLEDLARRRGASIGTLVREALDQTYGLDGVDPAEAADSFLARPPLDLGDWADAKREIDSGMERGAPA